MAQRCLSCMQMTEGGNCPHCGWPGKDTTESHQLAVGTMLRNRYQIGKVLGQGGFGITYLGWDTLLLQTVAIKEFYPSGSVFRRTAVSARVECATDAMIPHYEYTRERFLREAQALVQFREIPEVVDILDFIEENNTAYIVMEYVRGVDLAKYIAMKGGRLSVDETFRILKPVMEALAKVHKGGIVHRDISPDNIILDPMGGAKLLDFGAVRAVEDPEVDKGLNKSTEAILKQGFAPLEQYNTRGSLGPWTDEYAMCATVWYCLMGTPPEEATVRMLEGTDPDWSSIEGLPEHQQKALKKGISCRARDRYKSLDELLADLFPAAEAPEHRKEHEEVVPFKVPESEKVPAPPKEPEPEKKPMPKPMTELKPPKEPTPKPEKDIPAIVADPEEEDILRLRKRLKLSMLSAAVAAVILVCVLCLPRHSGAALPQIRNWFPRVTLLCESGTVKVYTIPPTDTDGTDPTEPVTNPNEAAYAEAERLLAEGKFQEAVDKFTELGNYRDSPLRRAYGEAEILLANSKLGEAAIAFGKLGDHADARARSFEVWDMLDRDTVSAGGSHAVGFKADGSVIAVGYNDHGQCDVSGWTDIVSVSAGDWHTVGLRSDGTVVAVGSNYNRQCDVSEWTDIVAISAGKFHTVGLRANGSVVAVGYNGDDQCDVSKWTNIVAISAGSSHTVGLMHDGTVVAVGHNDHGQCDMSDWTDIMAVSAGNGYTVGLRTDGTVIAVGDSEDGQCDVSDWTDIIAVSAGSRHTVGLRADGTVVAVGHNDHGQCDTSDWTDIVAVSAGNGHTVGLKADGTVVAVG